MKSIKIISTLGPSTLKSKFLKETKKDIDIFRLNMSHLTLDELIKNLKFLKKNKIKNICLDTEGAQIRTVKTKKKYFKKKTKIILSCKKNNNKNSIQLYPEFSFNGLKSKTKISIGFNGELGSKFCQSSISFVLIASSVTPTNARSPWFT